MSFVTAGAGARARTAGGDGLLALVPSGIPAAAAVQWYTPSYEGALDTGSLLDSADLTARG